MSVFITCITLALPTCRRTSHPVRRLCSYLRSCFICAIVLATIGPTGRTARRAGRLSPSRFPFINEPHVAERVCSTPLPPWITRANACKSRCWTTPPTAPRASCALWPRNLRRSQGLNIEYRHRQRSPRLQGRRAGRRPATRQPAISSPSSTPTFCPPPDWLRRTLPALTAHPELAFVQTRWAHLNRGQNPITAAQGLALDGHFVVEQQARSAAGFMQNFNGSGGLWRRAAIVDAGGWTDDTVTEDLDLSYRAQLRGWRGAYLNRWRRPLKLPPLLSSLQTPAKTLGQRLGPNPAQVGSGILRSDLPWLAAPVRLAASGRAMPPTCPCLPC